MLVVGGEQRPEDDGDGLRGVAVEVTADHFGIE
jgi:hypothetical protein